MFSYSYKRIHLNMVTSLGRLQTRAAQNNLWRECDVCLISWDQNHFALELWRLLLLLGLILERKLNGHLDGD